MTKPSPTRQALERLRTLGERALLAFFNEVTTKNNRALLAVLPSVDGFRKDSAASLPKRKQALLHQLFKKGGVTKTNKGRAEGAYYYIWRAWAEEHLEHVEGLAPLLDAIESATQKEHPQVAADQPQAEVEALFRSLHEQSFLNRCDAETIGRLLQFSPFEVTDPLERLVSGAKPLVAVEKDRELSVLPNRIQGHEMRLQELRGDIEGLSGEVARLAGTVAGIVARPAPVVDDGTSKRALDSVLAEIAALRKEFEVNGQTTTRVTAATEVRLKAVEHGVVDLEALWSDTEDRTGKRTSQLEQQLTDIAQRVAQFGQTTSPVIAQSDLAVVQPTPSVRVQLIGQTGPVRTLTTAVEAAALLASNYAAIGLKSSSATTFGEEVLTAVFACKVLFFKGSFSTELARVTATTLVGVHVVRARVPVGFVDASTLDTDVAKAFGDRNGAVGALVLERVNNVPFELLADVTADLVQNENIVVIATLADGVTTFPEQVLHLQLGPVFDTDVLEWSVFPKANATVTAGVLASLSPKALSVQASNGKAHSEELVRLLRRAPSFRNPHVERTATAFMNALEGFRTSDTPTSLQSLAYGWLWPLWRMTGLAAEDIEEELDGGQVDSENHVDARLRLLLDLAGIKRVAPR